MIRVCFHSTDEDPRPMHWPIKHPYWVQDEAGDGSYSLIVAYADDENYIMDNWPGAYDLNVTQETEYNFPGLFPMPKWWGEK